MKIKELDLLIFVIYRPGENKEAGFSQIMKKIDEHIDMAQSNGKYKNICGLGDYNFLDVVWVPGMLPANSTSITQENQQLNCLLDFLCSNLMFQVAKSPPDSIIYWI